MSVSCPHIQIYRYQCLYKSMYAYADDGECLHSQTVCLCQYKHCRHTSHVIPQWCHWLLFKLRIPSGVTSSWVEYGYLLIILHSPPSCEGRQHLISYHCPLMYSIPSQIAKSILLLASTIFYTHVAISTISSYQSHAVTHFECTCTPTYCVYIYILYILYK